MQSIKVKTFKVGVDSDKDINDFLASVRAVREGISLLSDGHMQIIYNDLETPEELAERLNGLSVESQVTTLRKKLAAAQETYFDHLIKIDESEITLADMTDDPEKKATKDMLDKQSNYLATLKKEEVYMRKTLTALRTMIKKVHAGELAA